MKNFITLLAIAVLFFQPILNNSIPQSDGNTILVNTLEDEKNEDGDCSLREAMEATINNQPVDACPIGSGNELDTILFAVDGIIILNSAFPELYAGPKFLIDGENKITIDCNGYGGLFRNPYATIEFTLRNIKITNSPASIITINKESQLEVENVTFENNPVGGPILSLYGRFHVNQSTFTNNGQEKKETFSILHQYANSGLIENSTFSGNKSKYAALEVDDGASLIVKDSTFTGNSSGVISTHGRLLVTGSIFDANTSMTYGGAISVQGSTSIIQSLFTNNHAAYSGGAISASQSLILESSTFFQNSSDGNGGALGVSAESDVAPYPTIQINNCTFTENSAPNYGGAIENGRWPMNPADSHTRISNSTFSNNTAPEGASLYNNSPGSKSALDLRNSIVAGPVGTQLCQGNVTDAGSNLDSGSTCGFTSAGSLSNVDPLLEPLANNGGRTPTQALQPGSPAIDGVLEGKCQSTVSGFQIVDQRGYFRPTDGNLDSLLHCDIGSYEANAAPVEIVYLPCTQREHCPPYLFDDFSTYNYNWPVGSDTVAEVGYAYNQYKVKVKDSYTTMAVRIQPKYQHPILLVNARPQSDLLKSYGIAFNISDDFTEFNTFEIYPNGKYEIWRHNPTSPYWRLLKEGSSGAIKTGTEWNTLKVDVDGPNISVYVNGHFIITVQESKYANGYRTAGLVSSTQEEHISTEIRFDNFTVYTRDCVEYAVPVVPVLLNLEYEAISIQERRPEIRP